ncbi:MAG: hypothetical protein D3926_11110 [Desulfobacteraceae bacterium]|nr:MAG: hypothetical protein D3926_11110 [Desulfobacteraceae bacterium]
MKSQAEDIVQSLLEEGYPVNKPAFGTSMFPAIPEKALLNIEPIRKIPPKLGDIVLLHIPGQQTKIHRIALLFRRNNKTWIQTWGDNCTYPDTPAPAENIMGRVTAYKAQGRWIQITNQRRTYVKLFLTRYVLFYVKTTIKKSLRRCNINFVPRLVALIQELDQRFTNRVEHKDKITYKLLKPFLRRTNQIIDTMAPAFGGFEGLEQITSRYYRKDPRFNNERYIFSGLFDWEKRVFDRILPGKKHLFLYAAGSGRELIWLARNGFHVDAYECNPTLIQLGNNTFSKYGFTCRVQYAPESTLPDLQQQYDLAVIGWGGYCHIFKQSDRIDLLKKFRKLNSPLMLSFMIPYFADRYIRLRQRVRLMFNRISFGLLPLHDESINCPVNFVPFVSFTRDRIEKEARLSGFRVDYYSEEDYGHAVLIPDHANKKNT